MIDVHAPEHRISGTRDFFVHLFTITIGLLIALGLENAAEAWHHRHQRDEAEETIQRELVYNKQHLIETEFVLQQETDNLTRAMAYLEARSAGRPGSGAGISLGYTMPHLRDASWKTANATGVVQYMPYEYVQRLSGAYDEQELLVEMQRDTLKSYLRLNSYIAANKDASSLSGDGVRSAMVDVRTTLVQLGAMRDVRRDLIESYDAALK
jgi:transposase